VIADCYNLQTEADLPAAIRDLKGFWKLWSACLLQSVSLPTPRGLIFTRGYPGLEDDLYRFLRSVGAASALIRHDMRDEKPPYPRGGFLVPESLLHVVVGFFFRQNRIVAVYEPADPLLNSYNLNLLFETPTKVWVEGLGPGFDASDLQRGDLSPHEVFSISLSANGAVTEIQRIRRVDQPEYEKSKQLRWQKIRRKLEQSPTPELARAIRTDLKLPESLEKHLRTVRSPLVEAQHYVPVAETLLTSTVSAIVDSGIINLFSSSTGVGFPLNFSTSLIDNGRRQVFWDIVSPALKFQGLKT
jgi:hypothetical protein